MNTKHTPTPLRVGPDEHNIIFTDADIVRAYNAHDDLVAVLENILMWDDGNLPGDILDDARTALAKARGE